ncbi:hypothetical protein KSP40_PGU021979 [Platanthera guangdongensis]|uniref:DUF8040 domain-containing protein n=1 Tax=Platanthera guangdongensis TaxID=2320717 RepID=A0ABR2LDI7_9ASPA
MSFVIFNVQEAIFVTQSILTREVIVLFLYILGHNKNFQDVGHAYMRSIDTVSKHFNIVLRGILKLSNDYIKLPESRVEPRS